MTQDALRAVRDEVGNLDSVASSNEERALVNDLPVKLDSDMRDLGAASLVLGNRDIDFHGHQADDLDRLAPLHGTPELQRQHCLRTAAQDGVDGSREALLECRTFIREQVTAALAGLGSDGRVNESSRTILRAPLDIRGPVDVLLPTYHVQMGRALHAVQDGFSHTYRSQDHLQVVSVLNYVELVEDSLDQNVDGPAHTSQLDECKGLDGFRKERLAVARQASTELLLLSLDPELNPNQKLDEVDEFLDSYFSHVEGCDADNAFCDAPERRYRDAPPTCSMAPGSSMQLWPSAGLLVLGFGLMLTRRRRSPRSRRAARAAHVLLPLFGMMLGARPASAQEPTGATTTAPPATPSQPDDSNLDPKQADAPPADVGGDDATRATVTGAVQSENPGIEAGHGEGENSAEPSPSSQPITAQVVASEDARMEEEPKQPWGIALNVSGAITNPAVAAALGARYRIDANWILGADVEQNPWYAEGTSKFRPGVASAYATVILRFPMRFERTNLRTTVQLGASRMMFDLYGVPEGTTGPFLGFNLLGIDYELGSQVYLVINPAHIAIPIPQTSGAPFSYTQYRLTFGLQLGS